MNAALKRWSTLCFGVMSHCHCLAAPVQIQCPALLPASSLRLVPAPDGWQFFAETHVYLHGAAPLVTPPEGLGHLVESTVRKGGGRTELLYEFKGPAPQGKWMQCAYGGYHEMTLSKRLDDATVRCSVTLREGERAGEKAIEITCE